MSDEESLRAVWVGLGGTADDATIDMVLARHREPHRRYHTATHVERVLHHVDTLIPAGVDADAVRAAALFHDVVYDPRSTTNEADSADIAVEALRPLSWDESRVDLVHRLIVATAGHDADSVEAEVLLDADLAILGTEPDAYAEYVNAVRFEYSFVDEAGWCSGRARILQTFLDRDHIFVTETMSAAREAQARRNLAAELASLEA